MANFLTRIGTKALALVTKTEGAWHPPPYYFPITGGTLPLAAGTIWNWWQAGYDVVSPSTRSAMVEACVSAYAQTIAMCPGDQWRANDKGGRERITNTGLSRILRKPNDYQSQSDFLLNLVRNLYLDGNAYALALRNERFEVIELHLMNSRSCAAQLAYNGDVFYHLGGNEIIEHRIEGALVVPARDVLHVKLQTPRHPLRGESPLMAAALDIAAADAITQQQIAFYQNMARPSYVLSTDQILNSEQVNFLRDKWVEQSRGLNAGGTPILTAGLKPQRLSATAEDSQLADILKMTEQHIALAFRIPLQVLGLGGVTYGSTELLMQSWIASGLGFALNHIEEAYGQLFQLKGWPDEYMELDTSALLRSAQRDRIDSLVRAVQGGIFAPNEARNSEGFDDVPFGDEPRVQQQLVPLSAAAAIPAAPPAPSALGPKSPPKLDQDDVDKLRRDFRSSLRRALGA